MSNKQNASGGIGISTILFLIFMTLKLTSHITWSWWWVTAPLWIPVLAAVLIAGVAILIAYIQYKINQ
jgi:hypothetical protein